MPWRSDRVPPPATGCEACHAEAWEGGGQGESGDCEPPARGRSRGCERQGREESGEKGKLLEGKVALVTGGAGINGLGFASALLMAGHGAQVVIIDLASADPQAARSEEHTSELQSQR